MDANKCFGSIVQVVVMASVLSPAMATMAQEDSSGAIEEIVVTAHRREQSLLEIPESVSVISGADITRQNIKSLEDVGFQVPNLNLSTRLDGFPNVSVRGLGAFGNTQGVGFYLDDVQLFSDASSRFGDLERIEILKGPQGTLYGGSNIGGAVKFVSARPDPEATFGRLNAVLGEQGIVDVEGSVNLPLSGGNWAMRAFGFTVTNDGYLKNPNPMRVNGLSGDNNEDIGESEESGVRLSLMGPLGDKLSAYVSVRANEYEGPNNTWIRELDETSLRHPNSVPASLNPRHERDTVSGMLELTWALEGYDITSVTSYTSTESSRFTDLDQREEYLLSLFRPEDMDVLTQEIRFTSTGEGSLQWLGGVYYSEYDEKMDSDLIWYNTTILPSGDITGPLGCAAGLPGCSGVWAGDNMLTLAQERDEITRTPFEKRQRDKSHLAAFINATYALGDWELSLGLRGDRWENDTLRFSTNHRADDGGTELLPRVSLTRWLSESSMLYGTMSRGYEPGGFNVSEDVADELVGFAPEEAVSFEAGWKGRLMDGRMTASLAAFYVDYEKRQIETQVPTAGAALVELINNVGDSEQFGLELDLRVVLSDTLSAAFSAGWIEAEWDNGTTVITGGDGANPVLKNIGGDTPPVTPDFSWSFSADYVQPMSEALRFIASMQVSYNGEYSGLRLSDPEGVNVVNPSFTLVGGQVGVAGENWELALNVENLLDEDYYTDVQTFPDFFFLDGDADSIIVIGTLGQPRLVTASFSYFF